MEHTDAQNAIRPWPIADADRKPKTISDYISLVNQTYPGGFRALNIDKINDGTIDESRDTKMVDVDGERNAGDSDDSLSGKDPVEARNESLQNIIVAHHSALFALDLVSLLLTKEAPVQAGLTLRQDLRDLVGIGTLASQKHAESNVTPDKMKDLGDITAGWHILSVEETRDSAKKAAGLLQEEVEKEAKFWDDVLSVAEAGWSVCRFPQERQTLGVKFGFNEASAEFRKNSLAPMRRAGDGSVELDLGNLGGQAQRLVVTVERDGIVTGIASQLVPAHVGDKGPLSAHVLEARNTIYARELWHELQMEARNLQSFDVRQYESSIVYTRPNGMKVRLELLSADSCPPVEHGLPENWLAESIHVSLHVLLGYAHRQNEIMRSRPWPPNQPRSRLQNQHYLLRPIIARLVHMEAIEDCTKYIGTLVKCLQNGKVSDAKFELATAQNKMTDLSTTSSDRVRSNPTQAVLGGITAPLVFLLEVTITPGNRVSILGRTWLRATATVYQITLPVTNPETPNTLVESCPPHRDYPNLAEVRCYVDQAVSCAMANYFQPRLEDAEKEGLLQKYGSLESPPASEGLDIEENAFWVKSVSGTSLHTSATSPREISFTVGGPTLNPHLEVTTMVRNEGAKVVKHVWNGEGSGGDTTEFGLSDVCLGLVKDVYS
ncbi:hypothetical protein jhhlp_004020 [Lomentospora prolificans]|uniref:Mediator of RNA polymerase II transcription subunit 17 n=1 Tax=Lomentospora prolificans TaxID=41688 RepID=A0A2N3NAD4_9PEZI|nr:hypothetical protein jhhlp_004020 [Lomentospora prolificans]